MKTLEEFKNMAIFEIFDLSVRSSNRIKNLNVNTIGELTHLDSLDPPNILCTWTNKAGKEIIEKLAALDLRINMTNEDWNEWGKNHSEYLKSISVDLP